MSGRFTAQRWMIGAAMYGSGQSPAPQTVTVVHMDTLRALRLVPSCTPPRRWLTAAFLVAIPVVPFTFVIGWWWPLFSLPLMLGMGAVSLVLRARQSVRVREGRFEFCRGRRVVLSTPLAGMRALRCAIRRGKRLRDWYQLLDASGAVLLLMPRDESWPQDELLLLFRTAGIPVGDLVAAPAGPVTIPDESPGDDTSS